MEVGMVTSAQYKLKMRGKKLVVKKGGIATLPPKDTVKTVTSLDLEDKLDRIIYNFRKKNGGLRGIA
jgi:hypothetical protein